MISFRQWQANRRNAAKSTGPVTPEGKERSRCNAVRHGLTAETVIGALEDAEDYRAFEAAIIADYDVQSAVERELVLRLASALWRLRRATVMETGLFEIEADHLSAIGTVPQLPPPSRDMVYASFRSDRSDGVQNDGLAAKRPRPATTRATSPHRQTHDEEPAADPSRHLAQCFLGLVTLPTYPLDRLSRYEYALWRQVAQILFALYNLSRRGPQERRPQKSGHGLSRSVFEQDRHFGDDQ
jgi:hypothetical protein